MREKIECDTQFRIGCSGCTLVSEENGTCVVRDCRICDIAIGYVRRKNLQDMKNCIPSISKSYMGVKYLSNSDGTVGLMSSIYDAFDAFPLDYKLVGYSANIVKRYPLLSTLRISLRLPIPNKVWWHKDAAPLIIEYVGSGRVYAIAPKTSQPMIRQ